MMYRISEQNMNSLLSEWRGRLSKDYDRSYKDALSECLFEMKGLLQESIDPIDVPDHFYPDDIIWESGDPMMYDEMENYFNSLEVDKYFNPRSIHDVV